MFKAIVSVLGGPHPIFRVCLQKFKLWEAVDRERTSSIKAKSPMYRYIDEILNT
jgi:hypothetical protein